MRCFFLAGTHGFAMVELTEAASKQKVDLHSRDEMSEGEVGSSVDSLKNRDMTKPALR